MNNLLRTKTFLQLTNISLTDKIKRKQSSTSLFFPSTCNLCYYFCCFYHCYSLKYLNNPARIKLFSTSLLVVCFSPKRLFCFAKENGYKCCLLFAKKVVHLFSFARQWLHMSSSSGNSSFKVKPFKKNVLIL